jgi:hypothetical protein
MTAAVRDGDGGGFGLGSAWDGDGGALDSAARGIGVSEGAQRLSGARDGDGGGAGGGADDDGAGVGDGDRTSVPLKACSRTAVPSSSSSGSRWRRHEAVHAFI